MAKLVFFKRINSLLIFAGMKTIVRFFFYLVVGVMAFACDSDVPSINRTFQGDNDFIKTITINGKIVSNYFYDDAGRILEEHSRYYFHRYLYDTNGRLEKVESAISPAIYSSSSSAINVKTDLMTSQNSSITNYIVYKYDNNGRVTSIDMYTKQINDPDGKFEHGLTRIFEYKDLLIVKASVVDPATGQIYPNYEYTYDSRGNIINEKNISTFNSKTEVVYEISYKYDNYKNPFRVMNPLGSPGMYTNPNNRIEINSTYYLSSDGINNTTLIQSYEYNSNGYPVKLIQDGKTVEEYVY